MAVRRGEHDKTRGPRNAERYEYLSEARVSPHDEVVLDSQWSAVDLVDRMLKVTEG